MKRTTKQVVDFLRSLKDYFAQELTLKINLFLYV